MVGHEQDVAAFVAAFQFVHQAAVAEEQLFAVLMDQGELRFQHCPKFGKFRIIVTALDGDRGADDQLLKLTGIALRFVRIQRNIGG